LGPDGDTVELHDIVRAHLRSSVQDRLADLHVALLDRFAAELPPSTSLSSDPNLIGVAWWCLADDLTFMREHLAAHIAESHRRPTFERHLGRRAVGGDPARTVGRCRPRPASARWASRGPSSRTRRTS
jgi:hypothetical protein